MTSRKKSMYFLIDPRTNYFVKNHSLFAGIIIDISSLVDYNDTKLAYTYSPSHFSAPKNSFTSTAYQLTTTSFHFHLMTLFSNVNFADILYFLKINFSETLLVQFPYHVIWIQRKPNLAFRIILEF